MDQIKQLQTQVAELMAWKEQKIRQQISYPLDVASKNILNQDFLMFDGYLNFVRASGEEVPNIRVRHDNITDLINIYHGLRIFIANASTEVITSDHHGFVNDNEILVISTDTLPGGLSDIVTYFVISATTNTFQVSLTLGGSAVDITSTGTGQHYAFPF